LDIYGSEIGLTPSTSVPTKSISFLVPAVLVVRGLSNQQFRPLLGMATIEALLLRLIRAAVKIFGSTFLPFGQRSFR
jgi:hypothetical protein